MLVITNQNVCTEDHSGPSLCMDRKEQLPDAQFLIYWGLWSRWKVSWSSKKVHLVVKVLKYGEASADPCLTLVLSNQGVPAVRTMALSYRWGCGSHNNWNDDFSLPSRNLSVIVIWISSHPFRQIAHENTEPPVG